MAAPPARQWGVTPPISTVLPTPDELVANDDLIAELKAQNNFEAPSETERRYVGIIMCLKGLQTLRADGSVTGNKCFSFFSA